MSGSIRMAEELQIVKLKEKGEKNMGKLIFITGPSGVGKSTFARLLTTECGIPEIVSYTTRAIRKGEIPDVSYHYVTKEEFDSIEMVERVEYSGNYYGTSKADIDMAMERNGLTCIVVEASGVKQLMEIVGAENTIRVYIDTRKDFLYDRFVERGDTPENIQKRLSIYDKDSNMRKDANYIVSNNKTVEDLKRSALHFMTRISN